MKFIPTSYKTSSSTKGSLRQRVMLRHIQDQIKYLEIKYWVRRLVRASLICWFQRHRKVWAYVKPSQSYSQLLTLENQGHGLGQVVGSLVLQGLHHCLVEEQGLANYLPCLSCGLAFILLPPKLFFFTVLTSTIKLLNRHYLWRTHSGSNGYIHPRTLLQLSLLLV